MQRKKNPLFGVTGVTLRLSGAGQVYETSGMRRSRTAIMSILLKGIIFSLEMRCEVRSGAGVTPGWAGPEREESQ